MTTDTILRAGVAQIDCALGDLEANIATHARVMREAREAGVELLLFPELSLTGYAVGPDAVRLARRPDDPLLRGLAMEAGDMTCVVGFVEEGYAAQFFNSAAVLKGGRVTFVHRKLNLATYGNLEEGKHFAPGRYLEVFEFDDTFTGAIMICADLWNPGLVHLSMLHGATLLMVPVCSAVDAVSGEFSNPDGWQTAMHFYGMIYGLPVMMANRAGREGDLMFWGGSRILDPYGHELARAGDGEELIVADIDYGEVKRARFQLPTVRDSNLALIHREIDRLSNRVGVPRALRKEI